MALATAITAAETGGASTDHRCFYGESLSVIDIRLLSQHELLSLSLSSSLTSTSTRVDDTDISTTKIDSSVLNVSAGSRKQTFSRLRLAPPRNYHFLPPNHQQQQQLEQQECGSHVEEEEDSQVVSLIGSLFGINPSLDNNDEKRDENRGCDSKLISVPISYSEYPFSINSVKTKGQSNSMPVQGSAGLSTVGSGGRKRGRPPKNKLGICPVGRLESTGDVPADVSGLLSGATSGKRRGRPRKNASHVTQICNVESVENVEKITDVPVEESGSLSVDLSARKRGGPEKYESYVHEISGEDSSSEIVLSNEEKVEEDPFSIELKRRTTAMRNEAELLGFLEGVGGEWVSVRKKRKIVDAGAFGDALPSGWKLVLCLRRRGNDSWVENQRYISPNGKQFMSFKEISPHLLSCSGLQDASQSNFGHTDGNIELIDQNAMIISTDVASTDDKEVDFSSDPPLFVSDESTENKNLVMQQKMESCDIQTTADYKCHKCTSSFEMEDGLLEHLLSFHHRTPKRERKEAFNREQVIIKNGNYECQICKKTFEERRSFHGHVGNHIKDYLKRLDTSSRTAFMNVPLPASSLVPPDRISILSDNGYEEKYTCVDSVSEVPSTMQPMQSVIEETFDFNSNVIINSTGSFDGSRIDEKGGTGNNTPADGFGSMSAMDGGRNLNSSVTTGNELPCAADNSRNWNEQLFTNNNTTRAQKCTVKKPNRGKEPDISQRTVSSCEPSSENEQPFAVKGVSTEDPLLQSGGRQIQSGEANLDAVTRTNQEELLLVDLEKPNLNQVVTGCDNTIQSNEKAIYDFMWPTNEDRSLLNGFADTSSRLVHTSDCFPMYDTTADKGGSEFEGLNMDNAEYNLFHSQISSNVDASKVFSYEADMGHGFDSSVWFEKDALPLSPKMHHILTVCMWCGNEFHDEAIDSNVQPGSMGLLCVVCKAKFSGQFNFP